jgi:hypothetical protein
MAMEFSAVPGFVFGEKVIRDRRERVVDKYRPTVTTEGEFDASLSIELAGAFVASTSSTAIPDADRSQLLTAKSLFLTDPDADVLPRDRIRVGGLVDDFTTGTPYLVVARPAADINPFTGWRPGVEIPLENAEG